MIKLESIKNSRIILFLGICALAGILLVWSLNNLMYFSNSQATSQEMNMDSNNNLELIGTSNGVLIFEESRLTTVIKLDRNVMKNVRRSLLQASATKLPDRIYLHIENVKGEMDGNLLNVSVNEQFAGHHSLYGIRRASDVENLNGGIGLTFVIDITKIIDKLYQDKVNHIDSLDVNILPENSIPNNQKITIDRISIYREQL